MSMASIVSAFANRPGGGTFILGLDEADGFTACGVYDAKAAQQQDHLDRWFRAGARRPGGDGGGAVR